MKKIAIVYDWIDKWGGVERVLLNLHQIFPKAVFYTSYYDKREASWAKNIDIKTSFIQKLPKFIKKSRLFSFPFYPYAFESLDFSHFDLVISVTSSFAKAIITRPETFHLCYLLTPTRYLWLYHQLYFGRFNPPHSLQRWDFIASQRPNEIISISKTVADRCLKYYQRKSEVIYPPFDIEYWTKIKSRISNIQYPISNFFLVVSRLEPYKKVDLAINVFNRLKETLIIVGKGSQLNKLKKQAKKNIIFLQDLTDQQLAVLYQNGQALIMPQEEDFGYVSLEAQFFGCPVIAYKKGGATETVLEAKTGIFFAAQKEKALTNALEKFHTLSYTLKQKTAKFGPENVERFSKQQFKIKFIDYINLKV